MTSPRQVSTSTVIDRPIFPHFSAVVMRSSWTATFRSRRSRPPLPRLCLAHFRRRSTTSKSIGPSLGVSLANAPCVCALRSLATAAAPSRLMTMITIGLGCGAAVANLATRPSPSCRPSRSLHPLQPDRAEPTNETFNWEKDNASVTTAGGSATQRIGRLIGKEVGAGEHPCAVE